LIELKSAPEIEKMAESGAVIGALFVELAQRVQPGVSTLELDAFSEEFIRSHEGAAPAFKGLYGFPGTLCTSINDEVVHGIPSSDRRLSEGDLISIDVGVKRNGWCSDSARTFGVGEISSEAKQLVEVTEAALLAAIDAARVGNHVGDIGHAVQEAVRPYGLSIIRDLVGHGVGKKVHEDPQVPNLGDPGVGPQLKEGMVLAIEPMIAVGTWKIRTLPDRWTLATADGSLSAHSEHTVAVTGKGPRILTNSEGAVPLFS